MEADTADLPLPRLAVSLIDDAQLVRRFADGDPDALGLIYDRYAASLYRLVHALLEQPSDAEDALQEVFASFAIARVDRIRDLRAYLFTAARREAYDTLRKRRREIAWEDVSELEVPSPETTVSPHDWATLLGKLSVEQREVIVLKVCEQMTFAEIAKVIGIPANTAMSRYRYGIDRLRSWCKESDDD